MTATQNHTLQYQPATAKTAIPSHATPVTLLLLNPAGAGTQLCVAGDPAPCTSPASACARRPSRPNTRLHVMLLELEHTQADGWMGYTTSARGCILLKTAARRGQGGDYRGQQSIDRARAMYGLAGWEKQGEAAGAVSGAGTNARCKTNKLQGKAGRGRARGTPAQSSSTQRVVRQRHRKLALTVKWKMPGMHVSSLRRAA